MSANLAPKGILGNVLSNVLSGNPPDLVKNLGGGQLLGVIQDKLDNLPLFDVLPDNVEAKVRNALDTAQNQLENLDLPNLPNLGDVLDGLNVPVANIGNIGNLLQDLIPAELPDQVQDKIAQALEQIEAKLGNLPDLLNGLLGGN